MYGPEALETFIFYFSGATKGAIIIKESHNLHTMIYQSKHLCKRVNLIDMNTFNIALFLF